MGTNDAWQTQSDGITPLDLVTQRTKNYLNKTHLLKLGSL